MIRQQTDLCYVYKILMLNRNAECEWLHWKWIQFLAFYITVTSTLS
jgi:hypothetical protein